MNYFQIACIISLPNTCNMIWSPLWYSGSCDCKQLLLSIAGKSKRHLTNTVFLCVFQKKELLLYYLLAPWTFILLQILTIPYKVIDRDKKYSTN